MRKKTFCMMALTVLILVSSASAQGSWRTYTTEDGIAGNDLWSVASDHRGGIWIGTAGILSIRTAGNGVSYFDGITWKTYRTSNSNIGSNDIYAIAVDLENVVWFAHTWEHIESFDGTTWRIHNDSPENPRDIQVDQNNVIWVGTYGNGLHRFDGINWRRISGIGNTPEILAVDPDTSLWVGIGYNGGVLNLKETTSTLYTTANGLVNNVVRGIAITNDGVKWFGTRNGVSRFDGTNWTTYTTSNGLVSNDVYAIAVDYDNVVWVGTTNGISSFDGHQWNSYTTSNSALEDNYICKIAVDIKNAKWFATREGGVTSFDYQLGPNVRLISPNGGDLWQSGSIQQITWWSDEVTNVKLEYSSDNGSIWQTIVENINASAGSYEWTLPEIESFNCLIRITDSDNAENTDTSTKVFTISPLYINVTSPNGNEYLVAGTIYPITWTSFGIENIMIEYSSDNGLIWHTIVESIDVTAGSYSWIIPEIISSECLLKISYTAYSYRSDVSDNVFSIGERQLPFFGTWMHRKNGIIIENIGV